MDRFYSKVDQSGDCHLWKAGKNSLGYGQFKIAGKHIGAHRISYALVNGWESIEGKVIIHSCDNPSCVKIEHLSLGTQKGNMGDCIAKGRNYQKSKLYCIKGHAYTPDNTYITSKGHRQCKECRHQRNKSRCLK